MIAHAAYMIDDLRPVGTVAMELQVREARVSMCNIGEQLVKLILVVFLLDKNVFRRLHNNQ